MDEPLSNLDAALRVQTRADIVELQSRLKTTTLYVTHDQVEAMTMGHRIAVMSEGSLQQVAAPEDLYARPANTFVARFLGSPGMNLLEGMLVESGRGARASWATGARWPWPSPVARCRCPTRWATSCAGAGPEVVLGLRPERAAPRCDGAHRGQRGHRGAARGRDPCDLQTENGTRIIVRQSPASPRPSLGEAVHIAVDGEASAYHLFDGASGLRLGSR